MTAVAVPATDFDRRWAAWQSKGTAQDRAYSQKMAVIAPVLILAALVVVWLLAR